MQETVSASRYEAVAPHMGLDQDAAFDNACAEPECDLQIEFEPKVGLVLRSRSASRAARGPDDMAALMARIQRRDETALGELHAACAGRLFGSALNIVHHAEIAREIVSIALMQAWCHAEDFDATRANVVTWLSMIVRSRALDLVRRNCTRSARECALLENGLEEIADGSPDPSHRLEQSQSLSRLRRAMATLTPVQRQVLSLTFLEGHSQEEAAEHIGLPLGTVKSHARRGLAALRSHAALRAVWA